MLEENCDIKDVVNTSFICKKKYLHLLNKQNSCIENINQDDNSQDQWLPRPEIFYSYTEDLKYPNRIDVAQKYLEADQCKLVDVNINKRLDIYSEKEAQNYYLTSDPTSFLIICKSQQNETILGKSIADYFHCEYIDPQLVLQDELYAKTNVGKCIEYNMKLGYSIGPETILKLVEKRVNSNKSKHKGFVIVGLPLIPNTNVNSQELLITESIVEIAQDTVDDMVVTATFLEPKKYNTPIENTSKTSIGTAGSEVEEQSKIGEESEADGADVTLETASKHSLLSDIGTIKSDVKFVTKTQEMNVENLLEHQLNTVFSFFKKPYVIIYIKGSDEEVIKRRSNIRYDVHSKRDINQLYPVKMDKSVKMLYDKQRSDNLIKEVRHLVRLPINFIHNMDCELDYYKNVILPIVDKFIIKHDQQYVMVLDGRIAPSKMFHIVRKKLNLLPLQKVVIPKKMFDPGNMLEFGKDEENGDEIGSNEDDFENKNDEFNDILRLHSISPRFQWQMSDWKTKCPISLFNDKLQIGDTKLSVHFMNKVFFLANSEAQIKFIRNPRPYLLPPNPKPTKKIFIIGPPFAGKTLVGQCLSCILNVPVIDIQQHFKSRIRDIFEQDKNEIHQKALEEGKVWAYKEMLNEYEKAQTEIKKWCKEALNFCNRFLNKSILNVEKEKSSYSLSELLIESVQKIPFNKQLCQSAIGNPDILLKYLPQEFKVSLPSEDIPDDDPYVHKYIQDAERKAFHNINLSDEIKCEIISTVLNDLKSDNSKYIIKGLPTSVNVWKYLIENKYTPDDIIYLYDSDEEYATLLKNSEIKKFCDIENILQNIAAGDQITIYESCKISAECVVDKILDDVVCSIETYQKPSEDENEYNMSIIKRFYDSWPDVESFLNKEKINIVGIEINGKTPNELISYVLNSYNLQYSLNAKTFTKEIIDDNVDIDEDDETSIDIPKLNTNEFDDVILGKTHKFCPYALYLYNVLWQGKKELAVDYQNKLYYFSSTPALDYFLKNPLKFCFETKPCNVFPPLRICVTGMFCTGRTTIAKKLAKELGLMYVNFTEHINNVLNPFNSPNIGRKYNNSNIVLKSNEDEEEKNQNNDENEIDDNNIYDYIDKRAPLSDQLIQQILMPLWFKKPYNVTGICIDGFPYNGSDINTMKQFYLIPNIVIELKASEKITKDRMLEQRIATWKEIILNLQLKKKEENEKVLEEVKCKRNELFDHLMNVEIIKKMLDNFVDTIVTKQESNEELEDRVDKIIISDNKSDDIDIEEIQNNVFEAIPLPEFNDVWEDEEEAAERLAEEVSNWYDEDVEHLHNMMLEATKENIPWVQVDTKKPIENAFLESCIHVDKYKYINQSFYEQTIEISVEESKLLLENGYYFLSRFGKICPVQIYEQQCPIQLFTANADKSKSQIYPIIHQQYIYFLLNKTNAETFKKNPLKYALQRNQNLPLIQYRIAVIGPPKSGKTALSKRICQELGFKIVSRGQSIRYVLQELHNSHLAEKIDKLLRICVTLPTSLVMQAVEAASYDDHEVIQGIVFDGFPTQKEECLQLHSVGLSPILFIDLNADIDYIQSCLQNDNISRQHFPVYSHLLLEHRFNKWKETKDEFRIWLQKEYQNMFSIKCIDTKWSNWDDAKTIIFRNLNEIVRYLQSNDANKPHSMKYMCVTADEYFKRKSIYQNYCPCCLLFDRALVGDVISPNRNNLFQLNKHYYYVCDKHIDHFLQSPLEFIPPRNKMILSKDLPRQLKPIQHKRNLPPLHQDGLCVVTFWENLPNHRLTKGKPEFCVYYRGKIFYFTNQKNMENFMMNPQKYANRTVNFKLQDKLPPIVCKNLPTMGYLEQFQSKILVAACTKVGMLRPKYPGLNPVVSALIYVGMYIKIHNSLTSELELRTYEKLLEQFIHKCSLLKKAIEVSRKVINPFIATPDEVLTNKPEYTSTNHSVSNISSISVLEEFSRLFYQGYTYLPIRRVPVPDTRFEYLCEFYKPASKVPAFLTIVDIAGLVKGASEGQGLGNNFLSEIGGCDAIFHLCRAFEDDDVIHVEGDVNPIRDLEIIGEELRLKDEEKLHKEVDKLQRAVGRGGDKKLKPEIDCLQKVKSVLVDDKQHIRFADWSTTEIEILNKHLFLTSKPALYLINLSEKDYIRKKNKWLIKIKEWVDKNDPGAIIIPFSGALENKLAEMEPEEKAKYLEQEKMTCALDKIIVQGYKALQLEYFFTAGADEVKAWTIQKGTKAPQAAGKIHTDFEKGFIMAEVMKFSDFKEEGTESAVKAAGKYRQQGRNYTVDDGDIIFFKFNAGAGLKDAKKK